MAEVTRYVSGKPPILSTSHNADGSPVLSRGMGTLVYLPNGEEVSIWEAMLRGLVKRDADGRFYEPA